MSKKYFFTDNNGEQYLDWERKKLEEVLSKYTDTTIYVEDDTLYNQLTVSTHTGISDRGTILGAQIGRKRQFVVNLTRYPVTLTFTRQTIMNGGIGFIDKKLDGSIVTENMPLLHLDTSKCKKEYLNQYLKSGHYKANVLFPIKPTGSAQQAVHEKDWLKQFIPIPSISEQQKIAEFFSALDERIALTADKVKLLKEQKKGYLQRVFSQEMTFTDDNGNAYPVWEQKNFTDVLETIPTKSHQIFSKDIKPVGKFEVVDQGKSQIAGYSDESEKVFSGIPAIVYGDHTTNVKFRKEEFIVGADGTKVLIAKNSDSIEFLFHAVCHFNVESEGYKRHYSILKDVSLPVPSFPEQKKIAEFFSALDEKIELTENKLALLKEQKKGYLQGIFG